MEYYGGVVKIKKPETFFEIWLPDRFGSKDQYKTTIEKLMTIHQENDQPFVREINEVLFWTKSYKSVQYLKGFIWTCIDKRWIANNYSSKDYKKILSNSFNIDFAAAPFKSVYADPPDAKYLKPFQNFPTNV